MTTLLILAMLAQPTPPGGGYGIFTPAGPHNLANGCLYFDQTNDSDSYLCRTGANEITLTLGGGTELVCDANYCTFAAGPMIGASIPFSDAAGTLTLQNVDALDATTETTIESAIDTLANLTSIQSQSVSLAGSVTVESGGLVANQDVTTDASVRFGTLLVGSTASATDFPYARTISSQADTGETLAANIGHVSEAVADGTYQSIGSQAYATTNGARGGFALRGNALVGDSADTGWAVAGQFYSTATHAGGSNRAIWASAANGADNYALYIAAGDTFYGAAVDVDLLDNTADAYCIDTDGKAGLVCMDTTNGSEKVSFSPNISTAGTLTVTGSSFLQGPSLNVGAYTSSSPHTITSQGYGGSSPFTVTTRSVAGAAASADLVMATGAQTSSSNYASGSWELGSGATTTDGNPGSGYIYTGTAGAGRADSSSVYMSVNGKHGAGGADVMELDGPTGNIKAYGGSTKGAHTLIYTKTESVTFAANPGDASKSTTTTMIPDGDILLGVTTRVTTAGTNCAGYDVGVAGGDDDMWGSDIAVAQNTTSDNSDATINWGTPISLADAEISITGTNGAGAATNCYGMVVAITSHLLKPVAASSN